MYEFCPRALAQKFYIHLPGVYEFYLLALVQKNVYSLTSGDDDDDGDGDDDDGGAGGGGPDNADGVADGYADHKCGSVLLTFCNAKPRCQCSLKSRSCCRMVFSDFRGRKYKSSIPSGNFPAHSSIDFAQKH